MTLQEYLENKLGEMAQQDANFRERYEDKQKSIKNCLLYISRLTSKPLAIVQPYPMMMSYRWQSTTTRKRM